MSFTKDHAEYFFLKGPLINAGPKGKNVFSCKCEELVGRRCSSMKNSFIVAVNAGYYNLRTHLLNCIPDFEDIFANRNAGVVTADIRRFVSVDKISQDIYHWIEWIVSSNLPFSFVDNELTRLNTAKTRGAICRSTLMKHIDQLGYEIEGILKDILPDRFAVAFDGWDNGNNTNYCGVFVMWYDNEKAINRVYLLRMAPLYRADDYGADSHIQTLVRFLGRVGKTLENVVVLCGDNCETNLAIARRTGIHFMGCHSHRLNLAVKLFLQPDEVILEKVNSLMIALSTKKNCGRLRAQNCLSMPLRRFIIR